MGRAKHLGLKKMGGNVLLSRTWEAIGGFGIWKLYNFGNPIGKFYNLNTGGKLGDYVFE